MQAPAAGTVAPPGAPRLGGEGPAGCGEESGQTFLRQKKRKSDGKVPGGPFCLRQAGLEAKHCHLHPGQVTRGKFQTPVSLSFLIHKVGPLSSSSKIMRGKMSCKVEGSVK